VVIAGTTRRWKVFFATFEDGTGASGELPDAGGDVSPWVKYIEGFSNRVRRHWALAPVE